MIACLPACPMRPECADVLRQISTGPARSHRTNQGAKDRSSGADIVTGGRSPVVKAGDSDSLQLFAHVSSLARLSPASPSLTPAFRLRGVPHEPELAGGSVSPRSQKSSVGSCLDVGLVTGVAKQVDEIRCH